jgi:aspartyl-tRNA(Asn)/glutamyl-tRNA(Gln) amidotransferase subunit C
MVAFAMPAGVTRAQVEAIAALAHLDLEPSEVELFTRQLCDILAYVDELQQIDTGGVPPTSHVAPGGASDRPDEVRPSLDPPDALANAPDAARETPLGSFFKVPRVIG